MGGAAFSTSPLRDAATGRAVPGLALTHSSLFVILAPFCDLFDMLTLLSGRQHIALVATVFGSYAVWRVVVRVRSQGRDHWMRELAKCLLCVVALAAIYLIGLLPRPTATLQPKDANIVRVDFHSHTSASHDGRRGFSAEENRAWHRATGFDIAYITDHRTFAGARAGQKLNPRSAAAGTVLLSGIETRYGGQHLNILGIDFRSGDAYLPSQILPAQFDISANDPAARPLILLTVPSVLSEVGRVHSESPTSIDLIELSDASPRGFSQMDSARPVILHLADSLNLAVVAGSDNHGWGWTAAAWSLLNVPGWRALPPDSLAARIDRTIRSRGREAVWVVERQRPTLSTKRSLALIAPVAIWTMLRAQEWPERISWIVWIWLIPGIALILRIRRSIPNVRLRRSARQPHALSHHPGTPRGVPWRDRTTVGRVVRRASLWLSLCLWICLPRHAGAQEKVADTIPAGSLTVRVRHLAEPIPGAVIRAGSLGALTDSAGNATLRLPAGSQTVIVGRLGFVPDTLSLEIAPASDTAIEVQLAPFAARLAAVIVGASRVERRVQDEPERVEVLSGEDVGEKSVMHPANPMNLVSEMPGVRVQTTSPALGGAGVRLQGLRGRYTLLLADGLPLYGSSSEGLGFLQIPPLDLAQAEVIKGAATALYGPAAAGGVLNLVSRRPPRGGRQVRELLVNQTSRNGTDGLLWLGARTSKQWGYTLLGGAHNQVGTDVNGDGWTDIPELRRGEIRPRAFWADSSGNSAMITAGGADEDRQSGTLGSSTTPAGTTFRVGARTRRADAGAVIRLLTKRGSIVTIRSSINQQWQDRRYGDSTESDRRGTAFGEATLSRTSGKHEMLVGAGLQEDGLASAKLSNATYQFVTGSLFGQDTYSPSDKFSVTATARLDRHSRYGTFLSPRVSALSRFADGWAARVSAGAGFFAPTPLVEEADVVGLSRIRGFAGLAAEKIAQVSADLTRTLGPVEVTGTMFSARLDHAVVVNENSPTPGILTLTNAPVPTRTGGANLFAVYNLEPFAVTALYSYTRSTEWAPDKARRLETPLTPHHAAGLDVAFEEDEMGTRAGLEIFYTGRQRLDDDPYRTSTLPYTTVGLLIEQRVGSATIFVNGENLTGVRQTRFDPLLLQSQDPTGRWTTPQWAPLEGRMLNAGVRVRF